MLLLLACISTALSFVYLNQSHNTAFLLLLGLLYGSLYGKMEKSVSKFLVTLRFIFENRIHRILHARSREATIRIVI